MSSKQPEKTRKKEYRIKVAFVYYSFSSFIKSDYEVLSKHFNVNKINYRRVWDAFRIMIAVLKSDVSFSWFAGGHAFLMVLFSKIFRKKSIVIAGGGDVAAVPEIDYGGMRKNKRSRFFAKFVLKHTNIVLAVSNFTKDEVLKYTKPKILKVVYNGIDVERFKPSGEKKDVVITVGSISDDVVKRKGFETFVKSAEYLPAVKFVLVGKHIDGSIEYLRSIAPSNVDFTDFVSDEELLKYYQRAKVYCQLSYYESFGMALAEAMACGCVPVVTDRGALPEVVGDTGFYGPYGTPKATAEVIRKALNSSGDLGKKARERIKNMFSIERRERELIEIIEEIVE